MRKEAILNYFLMNEQPPKYTLITGASLGIGRALAYECASRNMNLVLVALPGKELNNLTESLNKYYPIHAVSFTVDLTEEETPKKLYNWCKENNYQINILINNAGLGAGGLFEHINHEQYIKMIKLNNLALISITYYFLPELKKNREGYILNISSMEAMLPTPYKSVYTGTKNFVFSFSLALREELRSSNVKVSVLCPGPVLTNREGLLRIRAHGYRAKLIIMMPKKVANIAINKMLKGKGIIVPGYFNLTLTRISKLVPIFTRMKILESMFRVYKTQSG